MAKIIKLKLCDPSDGEFLNLDNVNAIAKGVKGVAKLFMTGGKVYETHCSFEAFIEILTSKGLLDEA